MPHWVGRGSRLLLVSIVSSVAVACGSSDNKALFGPAEPGPDAGVNTGVMTPDAGTMTPGIGGEMNRGDSGVGNACEVDFSSLMQNAILTADDDADMDCSNGIQVDLDVAATGAKVELRVNGGDAESEMVRNNEASFADVTVSGNGLTTLAISVPGEADCVATINVSGRCEFEPSCEITTPKFDEEKTGLNGVAAPEGDRVSKDGEPYRTTVEVSTDAADGQNVLLDTGEATLAARVSGGVARFPSVLLAPDGDFILNAECESGDLSGFATPLSVTVDSEAPEFVAENVSPVNGEHFSPEQDANSATPELEFDICVPVTSADALDLSGGTKDNVCVAVGTQAGDCAPATTGGLTGGGDGACVSVECPGSAAFDLNVTIRDQAGNSSRHAITGLTCASQEPSIQIVRPLDATNSPNDVSRRLLANSMPDPQLKDQDPLKAGAQTDVVACTNAIGGRAELLVGLADEELTPIAELDTLDVPEPGECPMGLTAVARFAGVTLPPSRQTVDGLLQKNTELKVRVIDASTEDNLSGPVRLWVDSVVPSVRLNVPSPLTFCDGAVAGTSDIVQKLRFFSSSFPAPLSVYVESGGMNGPISVVKGAAPADAVDVTFSPGQNVLLGSTTEPSGNIGFLVDCTVWVGNAAGVAWLAPALGTTALTAQGSAPLATRVPDADSNEPGWQGTLSVRVSKLAAGDVDSGSIQFQVNGENFGPALPLSGGVGDALTREVSLDTSTVTGGLPEKDGVTLRAQLLGTTPPVAASLSGLVVDTIVPGAPTDVVPSVGPNKEDRRWTRMLVTWNAAGDGEGGTDTVAGYRVAYSPDPIDTQEKFDAAFGDLDPLNVAGGVVVSSPPEAPGTMTQLLVSDLRLEQSYYFAVQAVDAAGNIGPFVQGDSGDETFGPAAKARFKTMILKPPGDLQLEFGISMDGSSDLTGDGLSDLVVGSTNKVYIFKGTVDGFSATPMVTITGGASGQFFGKSVAVVGDINKDLPADPTPVDVARSRDLVITALNEPDPGGGTGRAYVFFGRDWEAPENANLSVVAEDYDAVIGSSVNTYYNFVSHVGDFNNDGAPDFALTMPNYDVTPTAGTPAEGGIAIVLGSTVANQFNSVTLPSGGAGRAIFIVGSTPGAGLTSTFIEASQPVVGWGRIFGGNSGTAIIAANPKVSQLLAFGDSSAGSGVFLSDLAVDTHTGPTASRTGNFGIGLSSGFVTSVCNPTQPYSGDTSSIGSVDVFFSSAADPFPAPAVHLVDSSVNDNFGQVLVGNAFSGRSATFGTRMLGDQAESAPDLMVSSSTLTPVSGLTGVPTIRLIAGTRLQGMSGQVDLPASSANFDVEFSLLEVPGTRTPAKVGEGEWQGSLGAGLRDIDGDGYMDFAVSEFQPYSSLDGEIIILY